MGKYQFPPRDMSWAIPQSLALTVKPINTTLDQKNLKSAVALLDDAYNQYLPPGSDLAKKVKAFLQAHNSMNFVSADPGMNDVSAVWQMVNDKLSHGFGGIVGHKHFTPKKVAEAQTVNFKEKSPLKSSLKAWDFDPSKMAPAKITYKTYQTKQAWVVDGKLSCHPIHCLKFEEGDTVAISKTHATHAFDTEGWVIEQDTDAWQILKYKPGYEAIVAGVFLHFVYGKAQVEFYDKDLADIWAMGGKLMLIDMPTDIAGQLPKKLTKTELVHLLVGAGKKAFFKDGIYVHYGYWHSVKGNKKLAKEEVDNIADKTPIMPAPLDMPKPWKAKTKPWTVLGGKVVPAGPATVGSILPESGESWKEGDKIEVSQAALQTMPTEWFSYFQIVEKLLHKCSVIMEYVGAGAGMLAPDVAAKTLTDLLHQYKLADGSPVPSELGKMLGDVYAGTLEAKPVLADDVLYKQIKKLCPKYEPPADAQFIIKMDNIQGASEWDTIEVTYAMPDGVDLTHHVHIGTGDIIATSGFIPVKEPTPFTVPGGYAVQSIAQELYDQAPTDPHHGGKIWGPDSQPNQYPMKHGWHDKEKGLYWNKHCQLWQKTKPTVLSLCWKAYGKGPFVHGYYATVGYWHEDKKQWLLWEPEPLEQAADKASPKNKLPPTWIA